DNNLTLPPYMPSTAAPFYSEEPGTDERLLEYSPLLKYRPHTGTHIEQSGLDVVVLTEQDTSVDIPVYRRRARVNGFLVVEDRETVTEVTITVKGNVEVVVAERGSVAKNLLEEQQTLWRPSSSTSTCPDNIPFSPTLPTHFQDGDSSYPLPLSYNVAYSASGGLSVKIIYCVNLTVIRTRFIQSSAKHIISLKFNYCPRTRPARPIQPIVSDFLVDIKVMPEEWTQITTEMQARPKCTVAPLYLNAWSLSLSPTALFIPAAEVYALADTIPFHVQLTGPTTSLRELLPVVIKVTPIRQMLMQIHGDTERSRVAVGDTTLKSTPPGATAAERDSSHASGQP
ncbi:hypothetical protein DFH07DRAFT_752680, partial [Mycena maculata]